MPTWGTRGLRGSALEDMLNHTIEQYRQKKLALIQKIPTPIKPIHIDKETRHITLAYFDQKSTVDYMGAVQGIPVCFDAKESVTDTVPLQNIHAHQVDFMESLEGQGGISFIILYFSKRDEAYYLPLRDVLKYWERGQSGGRKSFSYDEIDKTYRIKLTGGIYLHFLEQLQMDLVTRDEQNE